MTIAKKTHDHDPLMRGTNDQEHDNACAPLQDANAVLPTQVGDGEHFQRRDLMADMYKVAAGLVLGATGAGILQRTVTAASGVSNTTQRIQQLQTAAAIENVLIQMYATIAQVHGQNGTSNALVSSTYQQIALHHSMHAQSYNQQVVKLGGKVQTTIDATLHQQVVMPGLARVIGPGSFFTLANTVETIATETFLAFAATVDATTPDFTLFTTIAPIEAEHASVMAVFASLASSGQLSLISSPMPQTTPGSAFSAGLPVASYGTKLARSSTEGALS